MLTQCTCFRGGLSASSLPPLPLEMGGTGMDISQMMPQMMPQQATAGESTSLCDDQKIGNYSLNPSTGAITVQAPHWILESVGKYLDNVKSDNAVTLVYEVC